MSRRIAIPIFLAAAIAGLVGYRLWSGTPGGPSAGETGQPVSGPEQTIMREANGKEQTVMVTRGVKHSVPLEEIISGGPPKDGIPSIDDPKFVPVAEANGWLGDEEPGVAFSRGRTHRFYPYQILVWHEIVNDTVGGERVLVTYCPLCLTGFVFDPLVKGERAEFGTSGKLWKSNLVMYDRKTESYWPQILGEAVVGEMTGTKLLLLPSDQVRYGEWKRAHPDGEVLSRDTGTTRFYGQNPYGGYFEPRDFAVSLAGVRDTRLKPEDFVFGVLVNGRAKAYPTAAAKARGEITDEFAGRTFVLRHDRELDAVRIFEREPDGALLRINPFSAFWFSWAAAHPGTEVFQ